MQPVQHVVGCADIVAVAAPITEPVMLGFRPDERGDGTRFGFGQAKPPAIPRVAAAIVTDDDFEQRQPVMQRGDGMAALVLSGAGEQVGDLGGPRGDHPTDHLLKTVIGGNSVDIGLYRPTHCLPCRALGSLGKAIKDFASAGIGALTYARRYALLSLVGIAGEDDLDAPDLTAPYGTGT